MPLPFQVGVPAAVSGGTGLSGPLPLWIGVPPAPDIVVPPDDGGDGGGGGWWFPGGDYREQLLRERLLRERLLREDDEILAIIMAAVEADLL